MTVRVYLPSTLGRLARARAAGELGPAPLRAHGVTAVVRAELADAGEEEWEYAASTAAAQESVALLRGDEPARRVVVALDVPAADHGTETRTRRPSRGAPVPWRRVAAVLADAAEAGAAVAASRDALASAGRRTPRPLLDRCLDHELGWWAVQEVDDLLAASGPR